MTAEDMLRDLHRRYSTVWLHRRYGTEYRLTAIRQPPVSGGAGSMVETTGRTALEAIERAWSPPRVQTGLAPPATRCEGYAWRSGVPSRYILTHAGWVETPMSDEGP